MFKNMSLGRKIGTGFAIITLISAIMGLIGIVSMSSAARNARLMEKEYIQQVVVSNNIERAMLNAMFELRGYSLSHDNTFLEKGKRYLDEVRVHLKAALELSSRSENLKNLETSVKIAQQGLDEYSKQIEDTVAIINDYNVRKENMIVNGARYASLLEQYIETQSKTMREELNGRTDHLILQKRLTKLIFSNDILKMGYAIQTSTWLAIEKKEPRMVEDSIKKFDLIISKIEALIPITVKEVNIRQLTETKLAAQNFKSDLEQLLAEILKLKEMTKLREKTVAKVVDAAKNVTDMGISDTSAMAKSSAFSLSASLIFMIVVILVTISLSIVLALFITRAIVAPTMRIIEKLSQSAQQVAAASGQVSQASEQLSESSSEQASSIQETSASLEQITGMVNNNVDNADHSSKTSENMKHISAQGNQSMENLIASMAQILESNQKISQLVKVIGQIGDKTAVIDEIVFQTKLLSFNASVEAERAGEHGRGFAVVAQEVGNLAQMSGKAALEISMIVKDSVFNAEWISSENKKKVEAGNLVVSETAKILKEIENSAVNVSDSAKHILNASKEQASGIDQISNAMAQLDRATQENASTAEEVASSSEELSAQAESLKEIVDELRVIVKGSSEEIDLSKGTGAYVGTAKKTIKGHMAGPGLKKTQAVVEEDVSERKDEDGWESL